ncbi:MAG: MFS transporter [Acidimicrobiales bacterium]
MTAGGLSLAAASTLAAARGLCSLPGRAFLAVAVRRLSAPGALLAAYLTMTVGTLLLLGATGGTAPAYAVVTGIAYGSLLPLQALVAAQVFPARRLGTLMGAQQGANSLVAASAPVLAGLTVDRTGSYAPLLVVVAIGFVASGWLIAPVLRAGPQPSPTPPDRSDTPPTNGPGPPGANGSRRPRRWARTGRRSPATASTGPASARR